MTTAAVSSDTSIRRCAVLKIDRKGRLIFLDEEAERLLGATQEELFGKPIIEFLSPTDESVIDEVTCRFSHYETSFDTTRVTLVTAERNEIGATIVVSQNFAAGNPVNYQIIITPQDDSGSDESADEGDPSNDFLALLTGSSPFSQPDRLAHTLKRFCGAVTVRVLDATDTPATLLARSNGADHHSGEDRATLDDYSERFSLPDGREIEVQVVAERDARTKDGTLVAERTTVALALLGKCCPRPQVPSDEESAEDFRTWTAVKLAGLAGVGAALVDFDGEIAEHNELFEDLFRPAKCNGTLTDLAEALMTPGQQPLSDRLEAHLKASSGLSDRVPFSHSVITPSGAAAELVFTLFEDQPEDRSGFLLLRPTRDVPRFGHLSGVFVAQTVNQLEGSLDATRDIWQKLEHEHHNELTGEGCFQLQCLSNHLSRLQATVKDLRRCSRAVTSNNPPQTVDLGLLVDQILADISSRHLRLGLSSRHSGLPKLSVDLDAVTAILSLTLEHLVERSRRGAVEIDVSAHREAGWHRIRISTGGDPLSRAVAARLFGYSPSAGGRTSLSVAREIARSLGGDMDIDSARKRGITLALTLPISERID